MAQKIVTVATVATSCTNRANLHDMAYYWLITHNSVLITC